ncbi:DUF3187 family protein [Pseudomonadota bacterium]
MIKKTTWAACSILISASAVNAEENNHYLAPFSIKNQNPFIQIYGLPATEPAELLAAGQRTTDVFLDITNNSMLNSVGNESIFLDGETYRLAVTLRLGKSGDIEYGVELPLIAHSKGFMDNFIEGWHDAFGLTNSERNKTPSNSLHYEYQRNGTTLLGFTQPNDGIGDVRMYAAKQLKNNSEGALSAHVSLKLPTGDSKHLHGSGAVDISASLAHLKQRWLSDWQLTTFLNGGLLLMGNSDYFDQVQRNAVGFGSTGIVWDAGKWIDLKAQLDGHTSFYKSELAQLKNHTIQLTIGGSVHFSSGGRLDIGVGENLLTDTTPDFLMNFAYKQPF